MKQLRLLACACLLSLQAFGQQTYMAGLDRQSLQPENESFTLALAGYGAPREGRFTLNWEKKDQLPAGLLLTAMGDQVYALNEKGALQQAPAGSFPLHWKPAGKAPQARSLSGEGNTLFLLDAAGNILTRKGQGRPWRRAGTAPDLKQIVVSGNTLYGLSQDGSIRKTALKSRKWQWQLLGRRRGAKNFVVHRQALYATTGSDTLWQLNTRQPAAGWLKAGYNNGFIQKVKPQALLVHDNKLYAADAQGVLYEAVKNEGKPADKLFATALAISRNKQAVLLLCVDLCGFDESLVREIKQELYRRKGIPPAAVLINASHTHFAPVTQAWTTWQPHNRLPDSTYLNQVVKPALLRAAENALEQMAPAAICFGRGKTAIGRNRSNGGLETPYDDAVDVLKVESLDGKKNYVMVLAGCHPVFGTAGLQNYTISSNYPGYMRQELEQKDAHTTALFMQGCAGDINPRDSQPEVTGSKLAADARQVLGQEMQLLQGKLSFFMDTLQAPAAPWPREKIVQFRQDNLREPGNVDMEKNVQWAGLMLRHYDQGTMPRHMPVYIQTINIGDWKLVGLSREVVTEYSTGIKNLWPGKLVSVAGYCNDVPSYLPAERHIRTSTYEGYNSALWYGQPSVFPDNIYELLLNRISQKNY